MRGLLIAFEGLDQSGKQTQAELLRDRLKQAGHKARLVSFPDYGTSIGEELARALQGERDFGPDVMQLLYVANRYERKPDLERWLGGGLILVCDRYERDLAMQARVRDSYQRQAQVQGWVVFDGERSKEVIAADVISAVASRLGLP